MDIIKLITSQLNNQETLNQLGQSVGANPDQVQKLTQMGMPMLLQALGQNASTQEGAAALSSALEQHQDDDVADINGFFKGVNTQDGAKILQHILPGKTEKVQQNLARETGLDAGQVSGLMTQLAPLLLGALGQQKKQQNLDVAGISGMLGGLLGQGGDKNMMGMVKNLLDADNDGNIMDDVGKLLGGFLKK